MLVVITCDYGQWNKHMFPPDCDVSEVIKTFLYSKGHDRWTHVCNDGATHLIEVENKKGNKWNEILYRLF